MRLLYSTGATADLRRLQAFIAQHDPAAAQRVVDALIARIEGLTDFPAMGRMVESAPALLHVREFVFDDHVVRYMASAETLVVLRIWHYREDRGEDQR